MKTFALAALAAASLALCACSTSNLFDNPQDDLNTFQTGLTVAEVGYAGLCAAEPSASYCSPAAQVTASAAEKLAQDAINTTQAVITAGGTDAQISAGLANVSTLVADAEAIFTDAKVKAAKPPG